MVIEGDAVPQHFIPQLISLYERGLSPFDKLIQSYDLDRINTAFNDSDSGRAIKPVIVYRPRGRTLAAPGPRQRASAQLRSGADGLESEAT